MTVEIEKTANTGGFSLIKNISILINQPESHF